MSGVYLYSKTDKPFQGLGGQSESCWKMLNLQITLPQNKKSIVPLQCVFLKHAHLQLHMIHIASRHRLQNLSRNTTSMKRNALNTSSLKSKSLINTT